MNRNESDRVHGRAPVTEQLVLRHPELVPLAQLSVEEQMSALGQLARNPGLIEPDGDERAAPIEDPCFHALLTPVSHGLDGDGANRYRNGGVLADGQLGDLVDGAPVAVRVGEVLDQVAQGLDAEGLELLEGSRESARPRVRADRRRGGLVVGQLVGGREARGRHSAQSSHHQAGWPPSWYSSSTPSGTLACTSSWPSGGASPAMQVRSSAPSTICSSVAASVAAGSPHATSSPPAYPPASPAVNRPCASSRAAGATPPIRSASAALATAAALSFAPRPGSNASSAASPSCGAVVGTTAAGLSDSSHARSAASITFGLFGSTTTSAPAAAWIPASSS